MSLGARNRRAGILAVFLAVIASQTAYTRSTSAPPLPAPQGAVVRVASEPELQDAVRALQSNTTILIAPGTYRLTSTLWINGSLTGVSVRGETGRRDDVVLVGNGLTHASSGLVPYGIATGGNVQGVEIANLTIRDVYDRAILFARGTQQPHVYNVHLLDAGAPMIEAHADSGPSVDGGVVEYSVLEYSGTARNADTNGIAIAGGSNWIIKHNLLRNIVGPSWQQAGPAIVARGGARNTIVEGNTIVNCSIGVAFGVEDLGGRDHRGGVVRNNMIARSGTVSGGPGILVADSPNTQVLNNTVVLSRTYGTPIEYQFPGAHDVVVANNLMDGAIWARDGASGIETNNANDASEDMFTDAASGDLHLTARAVTAIDRGIASPAVLDDWDGDPRPRGRAYDIGADEFGTITTLASNKTLTISGKVTASGNAPLPNVTISLTGSQTSTATTDAIGAYTFTNVPSGANYTVTPSLSGYTFNPAQITYNNLNSNQSNENYVGSTSGSGGGSGGGPGGGSGGATVPTAVTITAPSAGSSFAAPATITISATATDPTRAVREVTFAANSNTIGSASTSPYTTTWTNVAAGTYSVTATARFEKGAPATSDPITITVAAARVAAPTVAVVSPTSGATYTAPADVSIAASANAQAGVKKVDFFAGSTLIGSSTSSNASITWSGVAAGTYTVTAQVTDMQDATAQSAPVSVTVSATSPTPTPTPTPAPGTDPTTWRLLQPSNLVYAGAFRLPSSSSNGAFDFGGSPIAFNPAANSLFVGNYYSQVAEVSIPTPVNSPVVSDLPFAGYKQGFADPTEGHRADVGSVGVGLSGLLVSGGNLYGTAAVYYDANNDQTVSHYRRSTALATSSFSGFKSLWQPTASDVSNGVPANGTGYASGYVAAVPSAWQPLLGGPAISGQWGLPIVWRESYGPDAVVWDPAQLGSNSGKSLLYYTGTHATLGPWASASPMWGGTATNGGAALIEGTRTALFFGRNGLGTFCYGEGTSDRSLVGTINPTDGATYCYDPESSDKGQHAYPYVYQVWAYDLNDLAAVKSGSKQPWQVVPYATWTLNLPTAGSNLGGVGYDAAHQLLYVSQLRGDPDTYAYRAVIHVFSIQ